MFVFYETATTEISTCGHTLSLHDALPISARSVGGDTTATGRRKSSITLQHRLFDGFEAGASVEREMARVESAANRVMENSEVLALDAIGSYLESQNLDRKSTRLNSSH